MIKSGTICSFSKLSAHSSRMKPNRLKLTAVSTRKATIQAGCAIWIGTNSPEVARMMLPRMIDLLAAARTLGGTHKVLRLSNLSKSYSGGPR